MVRPAIDALGLYSRTLPLPVGAPGPLQSRVLSVPTTKGLRGVLAIQLSTPLASRGAALITVHVDSPRARKTMQFRISANGPTGTALGGERQGGIEVPIGGGFTVDAQAIGRAAGPDPILEVFFIQSGPGPIGRYNYVEDIALVGGVGTGPATEIGAPPMNAQHFRIATGPPNAGPAACIETEWRDAGNLPVAPFAEYNTAGTVQDTRLCLPGYFLWARAIGAPPQPIVVVWS